MAKSKIDIIYDMVNLAYDVKRQWSKDKDSIWLGEYARAVIKAKDEKVYDKFVDLANQLETEGWDEFINACKYLIDEYNQIEESKKSMKESEENFVYYIAVYDEDGNCRGYLQNESWRITQDIDKAMHFKRDMDAHEVILKATKRAFNDDELYIEGMYLNESKESARKSMKESINGDCYIYFDDDGEIYGKKRRWVFCDNVKGITNTRDFFPLNDFIIDAIHIFKNEKQAQKFIDVDCKYFEDKNKLVIAEYPQTVSGFFESKKSARKSIKESSDVTDKIASEIDKSYWINKLIDDLDKHYKPMEKAWLKNLDKLSDEEILDIVDDCMGKSKTLVGKSEMLKNKMIDDLSKAYDDYIDDIDRQIRIGKSEDEVKDMIETTLENDIKMYLKLAYNNKASSNYFMVKFAEDNLI